MHFFEAVGSTLMYRKRGGNIDMEQLNEIIAQIDDFVWGPVMLVLLVGTGIFLTFRTRFLTWRNL